MYLPDNLPGQEGSGGGCRMRGSLTYKLESNSFSAENQFINLPNIQSSCGLVIQLSLQDCLLKTKSFYLKHKDKQKPKTLKIPRWECFNCKPNIFPFLLWTNVSFVFYNNIYVLSDLRKF